MSWTTVSTMSKIQPGKPQRHKEHKEQIKNLYVFVSLWFSPAKMPENLLQSGLGHIKLV
jgi:hypothetical protein